MTWLRLDDGMAEHDKVDALSDGAFRLHVAGLCHAARNLTDGKIAKERVARLIPRFRARYVPELVDAGLWEPGTDGWAIHDYLEYNPSAADVLAKRAAAADRMKKARSPERSREQTEHVRLPHPIPSHNYSSSSSESDLEPPSPQVVDDDELQSEAVRRLERRLLEVGPVGDKQAWLTVCIQRLEAEHWEPTSVYVAHVCALCAGDGWVLDADGLAVKCPNVGTSA